MRSFIFWNSHEYQLRSIVSRPLYIHIKHAEFIQRFVPFAVAFNSTLGISMMYYKFTTLTAILMST